MEAPRLSEINLNLLVALDALLEAGTVTAAAERLGVSQSAASHSLRQLREVFQDPLLVRGAGGRMVRTPAADGLRGALRRGLTELERALAGEPTFDPATTHRAFRVAMGDVFALTVLPSLLTAMRQAAPGVDLVVRPWDRHLADALEDGDIDLGVGVGPPDRPGLRRRLALQEDLVSVVRVDHPQAEAAAELATWVQLPHILISPNGEVDGIVDGVLRGMGLSRRVQLRIPYFLAAPMVAAQTDLVLTGPRIMMMQMARALPLRLFEPPIPLPRFDVVELWHERMDADDAHRWLRAQVHTAIGALRG